MHSFIFRRIIALRQNYWFWPSTMTLIAVILGFLLPYLDSILGSEWLKVVSFLRPTQVDGARAILTTLAGATLGVAGVAFSVTIVAVSFASSNYGPRLIGNFMGDRTNQVVLGIFVATFVYCITVLSTVHARLELVQSTQDAFVPQLSVFFALLLTLAAVGALIGYIHHIPDSINIMNVTAQIGDKLQTSVITMLDDEDARRDKDLHPIDVEAWVPRPPADDAVVLRAKAAGYLQQVDLDGLARHAHEHAVQITIHCSPGDFLVPGEAIMSAMTSKTDNDAILTCMAKCITQGASRTDVQDVLFLSDQLVEVLGRALSPGINDPHTAMLCLNWLRAGLAGFATRPSVRPAQRNDPVRYRRLAFEDMLNRSFDRMRQYVAADRTVTLHALDILTGLAATAFNQPMSEACIRQMHRLVASSQDLLGETIARDEVETALQEALRAIAAARQESHAARPSGTF